MASALAEGQRQAQSAGTSDAEGPGNSAAGAPGEPPPPQVHAPTPLPSASLPTAPRPSMHLTPNETTGRRRGALVETSSGRYVGSAPYEPGVSGSLALAPTLRAAAPYQLARRLAQPGSGVLLRLEPADLQRQVRKAPAANLVLFAVDASGSMAARRRMEAAKGAVVSLLMDAYQKRDRAGLIAFGGERATLVLPPTSSVELAERALRALPTGGRTPLAHALHLAGEVFQHAAGSGQRSTPWLVLVTDGRPNVAFRTGDPYGDMMEAAAGLRAQGVQALVIDTESGGTRVGVNRRLARALGGEYLPMDALAAGGIAQAVRQRVHRQAANT